MSSNKQSVTMNIAAREFIQNLHPFSLLNEEELEKLYPVLELKEYPKDSQIYEHSQSTVDYISIIFEGLVEKYFVNKNGQKELSETFKVGDTFGEMSALLNLKYAIRDTVTLEDTKLLLLPIDYFSELLSQKEGFHEFFSSKFGKRALDERYAFYLRERLPQESFENADYFFQIPIERVCIRHVHTCLESTSIQEAAQLMHSYRTGYLIVRNDEGQYLGMITDFDFKIKVVAKGHSVQAPVTEIMSQPIAKIDSQAKIYEAILYMYRRKIKYLMVEKEGDYLGLVTRNKLLFYQSKSPFLFIQSIYNAIGVNELTESWQKVPSIIIELFDRGIKSETANEIITTIIDNIAHNVVERAIFSLKKIPVRFVYVALGSEGRKEQTLKTDQDNAIIFEDVDESKLESVQQYFLELGKLISDELNNIGFAYCKGDFMAQNPKWCQPISVWKQYYKSWINDGGGESLLNANIFFDARSIYGDSELLNDLRDATFQLLGNHSSLFFAHLVRSSVTTKPPLNFFAGFQLMKKDARKDVLDIKKAMQIIVDFARVYALKHKIAQTNTGNRLRALLNQNILNPKDFKELYQAYYYMMQLRLRNQINQINNEGVEPDNYLAPKLITKVEQVTLKEVFKILKKFQTRMSIEFTGSINN